MERGRSREMKNSKKPLVFEGSFEGSRVQRVFCENEQSAEKEWALVEKRQETDQKEERLASRHEMAV